MTDFYDDTIKWGPQNSSGWRENSSYAPPFFSLRGVGFIVAQNWYFLNLVTKRLRTNGYAVEGLSQSSEQVPSAVGAAIALRVPGDLQIAFDQDGTAIGLKRHLGCCSVDVAWFGSIVGISGRSRTPTLA